MSQKKYRKVKGGGFKNNETGEFIPNDPANSAFQDMKVWEAKGNTLGAEETAAEKTALTAARKLEVQEEIITLTLRLGVATDKGFTDIAAGLTTRIAALETELEGLK